MCAPIIAALPAIAPTIGAITPSAAIMPAISTLVGAAASGAAAVDMTSYNAAIASNNIALARQRQEIDRRRIENQRRQALGAQSAAIGKSGLQRSGSVLQVLDRTDRQFGYQIALNRHEFQVQRQQTEQRLEQQRFEAKAAKSRQRTQAITGLLGSWGKISEPHGDPIGKI